MLCLWMCSCLMGLLLTTAPASGCTVTTGAFSNTLAIYRCADCAYITKINVRAGCWLDAITSFVCSDGAITSVNVGSPSGGGPVSIASSEGFTTTLVGSADFNGGFAGVAGLRLVVPGGFVSTIAYDPGCGPTYTLDVNKTVAPTGGRIIGLQAQGTGSVTRLGFLAGTVKLVAVPPVVYKDGLSEFQVIRNNALLRVQSLSPDLKGTVLKNMVDCFFSSFALERARFNTKCPNVTNLVIDPANTGVAGAGGGTISVSAAYINANPLDYGLVAHEAMHIVQDYRVSSPEPTGHWVEGLADYARFKYGCNNSIAGWFLPSGVQPGQNYTDGYGVTARFLVWLENKVKSTIPNNLDSTCRAGTYTGSFWTGLTGKTVGQLWASYVASPAL